MDLTKILKNVPIGIKLWSPICGDCTLKEINNTQYPIKVGYIDESNMSETMSFTKDGKYEIVGECVLFPSKNNRDWNNFMQFKPFEKVLVPYYSDSRHKYRAAMFSHYDKATNKYYTIEGLGWDRDDLHKYDERLLGEQVYGE